MLRFLHHLSPGADNWLQSWADFSQKTSLYLGNETFQQPGSGVLAEKTEPTSSRCHWACPPPIVWILAASFEEQEEDMFLILSGPRTIAQNVMETEAIAVSRLALQVI